MTALTLVIAAGGTGGHFFPAEALAAELRARGHRIALMTDTRSSGLVSPSFEGCERFVLAGAGIAGRGALKAATALAALARGTAQAAAILRKLGAAAIVGFGGYPSVAPILAARFLKSRPATVLHEQNAVLGRANRWLSKSADLLALSHDSTTRVPAGVRTATTGNPVRPAIIALHGQGYVPPGERFELLILGGSLGARAFSDLIPPAVALLAPALQARLTVTQQCRAEDLARVGAAYAAAGIAAELAAFFPDVAARLARAHLVISRAGASSVAELATAGRPAILVPLPNAIDDHQRANAAALSDHGGAWLMPQSDLTPQHLATLLADLMTHPTRLAEAAAAAHHIGRPDAAARLADAVLAQLAGDRT